MHRNRRSTASIRRSYSVLRVRSTPICCDADVMTRPPGRQPPTRRDQMRLIGAGLPRTGTLTQKLALEQLGLGPCYHWVNVIADLDQVALWDRALDGEAIWEEVFAG